MKLSRTKNFSILESSTFPHPTNIRKFQLDFILDAKNSLK